jgi:hypothetical protein
MVGDAVAGAKPWAFAQWDTAAAVLDPHAVGVCVKPLLENVSSVDSAAFEQLMRRKPGERGKRERKQKRIQG